MLDVDTASSLATSPRSFEMSLELRNKEFYFRDIPINMLKEAALTIKKRSVNAKSKKKLLVLDL